jgi:lipopolysaccharide transport system permease protein
MPGRLRETYQYRELVRNLVVRDLKVRYKNSVVGFFWSLLNPLLTTLVFYVVFTILLPRGIENFPLFLLSGILPWNFFAVALKDGMNSVVANSHLIKKVYFPRELLPISAVLSQLVHFLFALPVLFLLMITSGAPFTLLLLYLPVVILVQVIFSCGIALFLAAVNVYFRDTEVIMDVAVTAWFFFTPIFYRMEDLAQNWNGINIERLMYIVNPMASLISNYRLMFYYVAPPNLLFMARTFATALGILVIGYIVFLRSCSRFGEEL